MSAHCSTCESDLAYDGSCSLCEARAEANSMSHALWPYWRQQKSMPAAEAIVKLIAEVDRLRAENARLHRGMSEGAGVEDGGAWEDRALLAETEVERLRAVVRAIVEVNDTPGGAIGDVEARLDAAHADVARRALGRPEHT
jgi:hypothetical protein